MREDYLLPYMAYKKYDDAGKNPDKKKKSQPAFSAFPKEQSDAPKKKKTYNTPYGSGFSKGKYEKKEPKKYIPEGERATKGFPKSRTGYNNPAAPWNRDKKVGPKEEVQWDFGYEKTKTFAKKWMLADPTQENHENNPSEYGTAKLQFRRVSKRAQRSFSKNKEAAYYAKKWETPEKITVSTGVPISVTPKPLREVPPPGLQQKSPHKKSNKKSHGKWARIESETGLRKKAKPNPKPFKAVLPKHTKKIGE